MIFSSEEKALARNLSREDLEKNYKNSEKLLRNASLNADKKAMNEHMKKHHKFEYAILFQNLLHGLKVKKQKAKNHKRSKVIRGKKK